MGSKKHRILEMELQVCETLRGNSAYETALINGFEGTEEEWLASLKGESGLSAYEIAKNNGYEGTEQEWLTSLEAAYDDTELKAELETIKNDIAETNNSVEELTTTTDTKITQLESNISTLESDLTTLNSQVQDEIAIDITNLKSDLTTLDEQAIKGISGNGTTIAPDSSGVVDITPSNIGAALSTHYHSTEEITSGTLPIERGGTGGATATAARTNLDVMKRTLLYQNDSGTTGTITLYGDVSNYEFIEVHWYRTSQLVTASMAQHYIGLFGGGCVQTGGVQVISTRFTIAGNTGTFSYQFYGFLSEVSDKWSPYPGSTGGAMVYRIYGLNY